MRKIRTLLILVSIIAVSCLTVSCNINSEVSSSIYSTPTSASSAEQSSSTPQKNIFNVAYFDGNELLYTSKVEDGECVTEYKNIPTKEKYTFEGWYLDSEFTNKYDFSTPVTKNITLFAYYKKILEKFEVSFYNGTELLNTTQVTEGECVSEYKDIPAKTDYTFEGWYKEAELTNAYDFTQPVTESFSLYASYRQVKFDISFYDGETLLNTTKVSEGDTVELYEAPSKISNDLKFVGWYLENELINAYDFSTPVTKNLSLYASYVPAEYFAKYVANYSPLYSPIALSSKLKDRDINPEIILTADGVDFSDVLTTKMISFKGCLEDLSVDSVSVNNSEMTIQTKGTVKNGEGKIVLSKEATKSNIYITTNVDITPYENRVKIDPFSLVYDKNSTTIYFSVVLTDITLNNPNNLSPDDYLQYLKGDGKALFTCDEVQDEQTFSVECTKIHDDFKGFDAKLTSNAGKIDWIFTNLRFNISLHMSGNLFSDGKPFDGHLIGDPLCRANITLEQKDTTSYYANLKIELTGCKVTDLFKNKKDDIINSELKNNLFISYPDSEIVATSMSFPSDFEINVSYVISTDKDLGNKQFTINLDKLVLNETTTVDLIKNVSTGENVTLPEISIPYTFLYDHKEDGTVSQAKSGAYSSVKEVVQDVAFKKEDKDVNSALDTATDVGKIAYGLVSNDYTMAQNAAGNILGNDSMRTPTTVIVESLQAIIKMLDRIENEIQGIREELDVIEEQLESISQQALLSDFITAYNAWTAFMTDYYTPMVDVINLYNNAYFRYFNDLVRSTSDKSNPKSIKLYYDYSGKLAYPDSTLVLSVDGRQINQAATKTIELPELVHALAGLRHNSGHTYSDIENDIIVDILGSNQYTTEELVDIIKTLRFNAMYSYFSNSSNADNYSNVFKNFCENLAGGSGVSVTPLDCLATLLSTIYNFGFETEADLNLAIIKLSNTYYCAKSIAQFADSVNQSHSSSTTYDSLNTRVQNELTSKRFFHPNDENGNVYCFNSNCYVKCTTDAYGIYAYFEWDDDDRLGGTRIVRSSDGKFNNHSPAYDTNSFSSISETAIKTMAIKVKIYNQLHGTNYKFKEYLEKIGILPSNKVNKVQGIVLDIEKLLRDTESDGDDWDELKVLTYSQEKMKHIYASKDDNYAVHTDDITGDYNAKNGTKYRWAVKGNVLSIEDASTTYTGLAAFYSLTEGKSVSTTRVVIATVSAYYSGTYIDDGTTYFPNFVYVWYLNFAQVS